MLLKETLRQIIRQQREMIQSRPLGVKREILGSIDRKSPHVVILSGIRRCGKSTLLHQLMAEYKHPLYFNFEDQRVWGFEVSDFEKLNEIFAEEFREGGPYFFDEIQNVQGWERFVRQMQEQGKKFFITGSNASLLSRELGTKLTGRHLSYELFPFSFSEMLQLQKLKPSVESFETYSQQGGFPEYLKFQNIDILQELFKDILARDIVLRYGLREVKTLQDIALYLVSNTGREFSYNGLRKYFQLGSTSTAKSYVHYLEECYLLFTLTRFSYSLKQQLMQPKKSYVIDPQLGKANAASFSPDQGRVLENIVFLALRRKYPDLFYFSEGKECDFLVKEKGKITQAYQVCLRLSEENKAREAGGLHAAMEKLSLKEGVILTLDQEDRLGRIKVLPIWKWL